MKRKGIIKRTLIVTLAILTILSCASIAFAAGWNGDGAVGGTSSSTANGTYAILRGNTAVGMIVGYRFSGRTGEDVEATPDSEILSIDIILKEREYEIDLLEKMVPQYSKADYFQLGCGSDNAVAVDDIRYMDSDSKLRGGLNVTTFYEKDMGFRTNLPNFTSTDLDGDLDAWQQWDENLDKIAVKLGFGSNGVSDMDYNDRIYIEPLYAIKLNGEDLMLTATEIAWYGAMKFGWDFNGKNNGAGNGNNANEWAFVGYNYTHRRVPNALYAPDKEGSLGWTLATGIATDSNTYNLTSYDILTGSWGVGICYIKESNVPDIVVSNMWAAKSNGQVLHNSAVPYDTYIYVWATLTNNSSQAQTINLYNYYGPSINSPTTDAKQETYYPATSCSTLNTNRWTPTFSSTTTSTPKEIQIAAGQTIKVRVRYAKYTAKTYVHFAAWLNGEKYSTTTTGAADGYDEIKKTNNYKYVSLTPVEPYDPNLTMTGVKICSDEAGKNEYPKVNGIYEIPQGETAYVFLKWKNTGNVDLRYDVYEIKQGGSLKSPARTNGSLSDGNEVLFLSCGQFKATETTAQTREGHVYLSGLTSASTETNANDNVITYQYKAIPQDVDLTVNHYLMNTDGSTYSLQTTETKSGVTIGSTVTLSGYAKSYSGFTYSFAQVNSSTVTSVYVDAAKTINLFYSRNMYTVSLTNGTGISGTTGGGSYYHGATVNINATVKTGYHWGNWTGTYSLADQKTSFTMPIGNVSLTANAVANTYTVTYYGNGSTSGSTDKSTHTYDVAKNLTANGFVRTGYYFTGWNTAADGSGTSYSNQQSVKNLTSTNGGNINLYAQWAPYKVTVYYHSNGATSIKDVNTAISEATLNGESYKQEFYYDQSYSNGLRDGNNSSALNMTKNGYTFTGKWHAGSATSTTLVDQTYGGTGQQMAAALGVSINSANQTVHVYGDWYEHRMTVVYHSNNATTIKYGGTTITDAKLQSDYQQTFLYDDSYSGGLRDANEASYLNMTRIGYYLSGNWIADSAAGSTKASWSYSGTGQQIAAQLGKTLVSGDITVHVYVEWIPYELTINYYSNYATNSFSNPANAVASNKNVLVRTEKLKYDQTNVSLRDHSASTDDTYLYRNRWYSTGYWGTGLDWDGIEVHEDTAYSYAQNLAAALGVSIDAQHQTINVYPQWTPHYDIELYDIFFKAYDSNGNLYTLNETQQQNIPIGTTVYVYYTYRNRSPVSVNITGYNTNGAAISYNGSTSYSIPGWDATLTVAAGSFTATPLGIANMSGSVYINGVSVSNESTDIDGNAKNNNTRTESYHVKFDVAIVDIYLTDYEGNVVDMNAKIPVNSEVIIHHVYRNNSSVAYTVNGYDNAGNKVTYNGTQKFTIPAYSTIDIVVGEMRTPETAGAFSLTGHVYRDGKTAATEKDEWDLNNNVYTKNYNTELGPYLTPITPNAAYREGTEVITSYWVVNPTTKNYTTSNEILVRIKIYDTYSGNLITELTKTTVVPAGETQLVYFKWNVPYLENYNDIKIIADLDLPEYSYWWGRISKNYDYGIWNVNYTPDTGYEDKQPAGWQRPGTEADAKGKTSWEVWEYSNGTYTKKLYGIQATGGDLILTPQSKTAYKENYMWYMKAGYGFTAEATIAKIDKYSGSSYLKPGTDAYTGAQYAYMYYPEFQYQISSNTTDTMEMADGKWQLFEFLDYGRVHFTPIWFPDGTYDAVMVQSDIWTPMGMITTQKVSSVVIEGDMYDDWYVQGT